MERQAVDWHPADWQHAEFNPKNLWPVGVLALLIVSGVFAVSWFTSEYVTGIVCDQNGLPVEGVIISSQETGVVAKTNKDGYYQIRLPEGKRVIFFRKPGYMRTPLIVTIALYAKVKKDVTIRLECYQKEN